MKLKSLLKEGHGKNISNIQEVILIYKGYTIEVRRYRKGSITLFYGYVKLLDIVTEDCDTRRQAIARGKIFVDRWIADAEKRH